MNRIDKRQIKSQRTYAMRYKRPALASMSYEAITSELWEIREAVSDVQWFMESDDETLLNALDGDDEAEWEFRVAFSELSGKLDSFEEQLEQAKRDAEWILHGDFEKIFDDHLVALIGNRYRTIGYYQDADDCEDYEALTGYYADLACTEAGKRVTRATKANMLSIIGQCLGILLAFLDLRQQYDYLKATFDILRDENTSLLQTIKELNRLYDAAMREGQYSNEMKTFEQMLSGLPERTWLE